MVKLQAGQAYVVVQAFTDFDNRLHPVGERWVFLRDSFLPYDSGLTWVVQTPEEAQWDDPHVVGRARTTGSD